MLEVAGVCEGSRTKLRLRLHACLQVSAAAVAACRVIINTTSRTIKYSQRGVRLAERQLVVADAGRRAVVDAHRISRSRRWQQLQQQQQQTQHRLPCNTTIGGRGLFICGRVWSTELAMADFDYQGRYRETERRAFGDGKSAEEGNASMDPSQVAVAPLCAARAGRTPYL